VEQSSDIWPLFRPFVEVDMHKVDKSRPWNLEVWKSPIELSRLPHSS